MGATRPHTGLNHRFIPLTIVLFLLIGDGLSCKSSSFITDSYQQAILKECMANGYTAIHRSAKDHKFGFGNHNLLFLRPVRFVPYSKVFAFNYILSHVWNVVCHLYSYWWLLIHILHIFLANPVFFEEGNQQHDLKHQFHPTRGAKNVEKWNQNVQEQSLQK